MRKKLKHNRGYVAARQGEYPPFLDFIDAYYWERRGDPKPMEAYLAAVDEVKEKFPKGEPKK